MYNDDVVVSKDLNKNIELDVNKAIGSLVERYEQNIHNGIEEPRLNKESVAYIFKNYFDTSLRPVVNLIGILLVFNFILLNFGEVANLNFIKNESFLKIAYYFHQNYDYKYFFFIKEALPNSFMIGDIYYSVYFHTPSLLLVETVVLSLFLLMQSYFMYMWIKTRNFPYGKGAMEYISQNIFKNVFHIKYLIIYLIAINLLTYFAYIHSDTCHYYFVHFFDIQSENGILFSRANQYSLLNLVFFFNLTFLAILKLLKKI